jgi:hypothetical protein
LHEDAQGADAVERNPSLDEWRVRAAHDLEGAEPGRSGSSCRPLALFEVFQGFRPVLAQELR